MVHSVGPNQHSNGVTVVRHPLVYVHDVQFIVTVVTRRPVMFVPVEIHAVFRLISPQAVYRSTDLRTLRQELYQRISVRTNVFQRTLLRGRLRRLNCAISREQRVNVLVVITATRDGTEGILRASLLNCTRHA